MKDNETKDLTLLASIKSKIIDFCCCCFKSDSEQMDVELVHPKGATSSDAWEQSITHEKPAVVESEGSTQTVAATAITTGNHTPAPPESKHSHLDRDPLSLAISASAQSAVQVIPVINRASRTSSDPLAAAIPVMTTQFEAQKANTGVEIETPSPLATSVVIPATQLQSGITNRL